MPAKIEIDKGKLEGMVMFGATCLECAEILGCSDDTIRNFVHSEYGLTFSVFSHQKKGQIRYKLRRKQIELALAGNVTLLIWCGKNILGQSEQGLADEAPQDRPDAAKVADIKKRIQAVSEETHLIESTR